MLKISGNKGLLFGDLHADDEFKGRHVDYWSNFIDNVERIQQVIAEEKPDFVVFAGDLVGVRRGVSTLRSRSALQYLGLFLKSITNCIVLKGNHDYSEESDYEVLASLEAFKSTKQIGGMVEFTNPFSDTPCYFHCIDYGSENNSIDIRENAYNIGVAHNEFYVKGKEQQFHSKGAIELTSKSNFFGLDLLMSGHIHTPSKNMIEFKFQDGFDSGFINLGCPTRPSHGELYDQVWYVAVEYSKTEGSSAWDLSFRQEVLKLKPYTEVFRVDEDFLEDRDEDEDIDDFTGIRKSKLEDILNHMATTNMGSSDFFKQIDSLTLVPDDAKDIAKRYLLKAVNK